MGLHPSILQLLFVKMFFIFIPMIAQIPAIPTSKVSEKAVTSHHNQRPFHLGCDFTIFYLGW
jgi:hypothetical protein